MIFARREGERLSACGEGADTDETYILPRDFRGAFIPAGDADACWVNEGGGAHEYGHAVAQHLIFGSLHFRADDLLAAMEQIGHVDIALDGITAAINERSRMPVR